MLVFGVFWALCVAKISSVRVPISYETRDEDTDSKFSDFITDLYSDSWPNADPIASLMEQTKDIGLTAWDHLSNAATSVGSSVGGFASNVLKKGAKHTANILVAGHDLVANNLEGAKKLGEEGLAMADKAFGYLSDSLPKFPYLEVRSMKKSNGEAEEYGRRWS